MRGAWALIAAGCVLATGCAATPTTLMVRAVFPEGEAIGAPFLDVAITGYGGGRGSKLIFERTALDAGDRDQTFVVILSSPAVGQTLDVVVHLREDDDGLSDGGTDGIGVDATSGETAGRIVAAGSGSILIVGDRDNSLTIDLARL